MKRKVKTGPVCSNCKTQDTLLRIKGTNNIYSCNACGLYYNIYKQSKPSKYRLTTCRNRKRLHRERDGTSGDGTPECDALGGDACTPCNRPSSFIQDPDVYNGIAAVNQGQPLVVEKVEPNERIKEVAETLFDVFGEESKDKVEEKHDSMQETNDTMEVKKGIYEETTHADGAHLLERICEGGEKMFAYKTGISFHVGKHVYASFHSAGASQNRCISVVSPGPNCFRTSQNRAQSYMDVSGGIEFPKIRMVPVDSFRFRHRYRRRSLLSKEEMEAAEALADFAYRVRHGECD